MRALLLSHQMHAERGEELARRAAAHAIPLRMIVLPEDVDARLANEDCAAVELAFFSEDIFPTYSRQFFSAVRKAPKLEWLHIFNAGVDHPIYTEMLDRGVRLTTSSGVTAAPIAQSAVAGLLMLARKFPHWMEARKRREWAPMRGKETPPDLRDQTVVLVGVGHIGSEIARLAQTLGMHVIGIRRDTSRMEDGVDEIHSPDRLDEMLPRAAWLVLACPLTEETRGLIGRAALARLPKGARFINIARGEIVDEAALIEALQSGHVGGAYLDVFQKEPLPGDSPLWDMPNVIVSPHNAGAATGNAARIYEMFWDNLTRLHRSAPLRNEVKGNEARA